MLNVTEEAVGDGLGQVTEPDIAERAVVCEAVDSKEEDINNAPKKSTVPFFMCQNILPASRGEEIRLDDELFLGTLCMHPNRQHKKTYVEPVTPQW